MIQRMNQRERVFVALGLTVVLAMFVYFALVNPYRSSLERLDRALASSQGQLLEMRQLQLEHQELSRSVRQLEVRLEQTVGFAPLAFIEGLVSQVANREKLVYMKPQTPVAEGDLRLEPIELKVESLDLQQVLLLLWEIDRAQAPLLVTDLRLKQRFDNRALLDLTMNVTAVRRN